MINTAWLKTASLRSFVNETDWVWPACEAIHFIGLGLAFGVVLLLNLRMLGMMKAVAFADLHRTLPWGMLGFAVNLVTGMLFFIGVPEQYTNNAAVPVEDRLPGAARRQPDLLHLAHRPVAGGGRRAMRRDRSR